MNPSFGVGCVDSSVGGDAALGLSSGGQWVLRALAKKSNMNNIKKAELASQKETS